MLADMFITADSVPEHEPPLADPLPDRIGGDLIDRHFLEDLVRPAGKLVTELRDNYPGVAESLSRSRAWVDMVLALYKAEGELK